MTAFEIYTLFGAPIVMLVGVLAVVWITGIQDSRAKHNRDEHHAAE
jgi:hypothetical protein